MALYGAEVYDTAVAWNHAVFRLDVQLERLDELAHAVILGIPLGIEDLRDVVLEVVRRMELGNAYVKVVATRGVGAQPLLSPYNCEPGLIAFAVPYMSLVGARGEDEAITMIASPMRRVPNESLSTRIKSCNYLNHVLMRMEASEAGADEALEFDLEDCVCEPPGYNVFLVKHGARCTPADNIVCGVMRPSSSILKFEWPEGRFAATRSLV